MGGAPDCEKFQLINLYLPMGGAPDCEKFQLICFYLPRWGAPPIARQIANALKERHSICMMGSQDGCWHPCSLAVGGAADCETPREILVYDWELDTGAAPVPSSQ